MTYRSRRFQYRDRGLYDATTMSHPPGGGFSIWERSQLNPSGNRWRGPRPAVGQWRWEGHAPESMGTSYGWEYRGGIERGVGVRRPTEQLPYRRGGFQQGRPVLTERRARGDLGTSEWDYADEGSEGGWGGGVGVRRTSADFRDYGERRPRPHRGGRARYDMHGEVWRPAARPHRHQRYEGEYRPGTMWRHEDVWADDARQARRARRHRDWDRGSTDWERASPFS